MLSLIEVKCPHCGTQGQIMLPPLGAIIVGPCPECDGMVVVFCGRVLPLDSGIMTRGSVEEREDHLMDVLGAFLQDRVHRLFEGQLGATSADLPGRLLENDELGHETELGKITPFGIPPEAPIAQEELDSFVNVDLKLIDNKEYFKAVFE